MLFMQLLDNSTWPWLLLGIIIVLIFVFRWQYKRSKKSYTDETEREKKMLSQQKLEVTERMDTLILELEEMRRKTSAVLDNKIRMLTQLLVDAEKKIRQLKELSNEGQTPSSPPANTTASMEEGDSEEQKLRQSFQNQPLDDRYKKVYELCDKGMSPVEIARETDMHPGEVELILGLRKRNTDDKKNFE